MTTQSIKNFSEEDAKYLFYHPDAKIVRGDGKYKYKVLKK